MKCQICASNNSRNDHGTKMCNSCNFPCVPTSEFTRDLYRKEWARIHDDMINGHKHGTWADQPDVMVCA